LAGKEIAMEQNRKKIEKTVLSFFLNSLWQIQNQEWSEEEDLLILTVSAGRETNFPFFTIFIGREKNSGQAEGQTNLSVSARKELDRQLGEKMAISGSARDFPLLLKQTSNWMENLAGGQKC